MSAVADPRTWLWQRIRMLRAAPPGNVDDERRPTFTAALEQLEELVKAAEAVAPAAQPLPLFYALSQGGRAVAAARLDDEWELRGHGLSVPSQRDVPLLEWMVRPKPATKGRDSFHGVAAAVGSQTPAGEVPLGALWAALPELIDPGLPGRPWPTPLQLFPDAMPNDLTALIASPVADAAVAGLPADPTIDVFREHLAQYPTMRDVQPLSIPGPDIVPHVTVPGVGLLPQVQWQAESARVWDHTLALDRIAPQYMHRGRRYAIPALPCGELVAPISLWWALLLALSSVARYEPAPWRAALDVDRSELAVPLERLLAQAAISIPYLVLDAVTDEHVLIPAGP